MSPVGGCSASDLSREAVARLLRTQRLGQALVLLDEVDSTNDEVARRVRSGAPPGLVVVARHQTRGRGRHGRPWIDRPDRSLLFSIALRPESERYWLAGLPLAAGIALVDSVKEITGVSPQLKWPNDLLVGDRKLAGILIEAKSHSGWPRLVIVGIGLNVALVERPLPPEIAARATSLEAAGATRMDRSLLLATTLLHFERELPRIAAGDQRGIADRWLERAAPLPRCVTVRRGLEILIGEPVALDPLTGLTLRLANGQLESILPPAIELLD